MDTISATISNPMIINNNNATTNSNNQLSLGANNQLQSSDLKPRVNDNKNDSTNHIINSTSYSIRMSNLNNVRPHFDPLEVDSIIKCLLLDIINKVQSHQENQEQQIYDESINLPSENSSPGDNSCDLVIDSSSLPNESPPTPSIDEEERTSEDNVATPDQEKQQQPQTNSNPNNIELHDNADDEEKVFITLEPVEIKKSSQEIQEQMEELKTHDTEMRTAQNEKYVEPIIETDEAPAKRKLDTSSEQGSENCEASDSVRGKRRRTKTQLFQAGEQQVDSDQTETYSPIKERKPKKTTTNSHQIIASHTGSQTSASESEKPDVIFYARNSFLAIRNEENSFYLCQLMENVRKLADYVKIKWLDTDNNGQTYYITQQTDQIPIKSILMQVLLQNKEVPKKSRKLFILGEQEKANIMTNLEMSLTIQP